MQTRKNLGLFGKGYSSLQAIYPFPTVFSKDCSFVTSNLSFSHTVFKRLLMQTRKNQGLFGKGLTKQNFILYQIVSICRQRNRPKLYSKIDAFYWMSRKQCARRRKCWFLKHDPSLYIKTLKMTLHKQRKSPTAVGKVESRG